ncbi:MAG TPA: hypothetical protein VFE53_16605 [Mucilaginibacter sp.]|nr:hypothetical protein [Mucilaginibacter sp.]
MKPLNKILAGSLFLVLLLQAYNGFSQGADKGSLSITVSYYVANNKIPSLGVKVKTKVKGKFQNVGGIALGLFLDKDTATNLVGKVVTDEHGEAYTNIPPSLKKQWNASVKHTFIAAFRGNTKYDSTSGDFTANRAKILIDTVSGRSVVATVFEMKDSTWKPVKGVDVVIAVKRMGGDLNVNETPTFSTDSTGKASADFKRDTIPGDLKGNIILVAKVLDNDQYGNLSIEKTVPWGAKFVAKNEDFNARTLFATRAKAPIWLIFMATGITFAVWIVLVLLVLNIFKIKKLSQEA